MKGASQTRAGPERARQGPNCAKRPTDKLGKKRRGSMDTTLPPQFLGYRNAE